MRWTCQREPHVDWTLRVPHAGHHVADRTPGWDPMPGWDSSGDRYTRRSSPGRDRCCAEWHTRRTNTTQQTSNITGSHCQLGRLLYVPPSCMPQASTHSTRVSTNRTDVGALSTRCEHAQYPVWVPMPVLRKAHAATQRYSCGRPKYPIWVPIRPHESTQSLLSDHF